MNSECDTIISKLRRYFCVFSVPRIQDGIHFDPKFVFTDSEWLLHITDPCHSLPTMMISTLYIANSNHLLHNGKQ